MIPAREPHPDARQKSDELDRLTTQVAARRALDTKLPDLAELPLEVLAEAGRRDPMDFGQVAMLELKRRQLAEVVPAMEKANREWEAEQEKKAATLRAFEAEKLRLRQEEEQRGISRADFWCRSGAELIASCENLGRDDSKPRAERQRHMDAVQRELLTRRSEGVPMDAAPRRFFGRNEP